MLLKRGMPWGFFVSDVREFTERARKENFCGRNYILNVFCFFVCEEKCYFRVNLCENFYCESW